MFSGWRSRSVNALLASVEGPGTAVFGGKFGRSDLGFTTGFGIAPGCGFLLGFWFNLAFGVVLGSGEVGGATEGFSLVGATLGQSCLSPGRIDLRSELLGDFCRSRPRLVAESIGSNGFRIGLSVGSMLNFSAGLSFIAGTFTVGTDEPEIGESTLLLSGVPAVTPPIFGSGKDSLTLALPF